MTERAGLDLVKKFEQCKLKAFKPIDTDPWTIGYGRTHGVMDGDTCTQEEAEKWLLEDYDEAEGIVRHFVNVYLTDNQLGALTSFVYNVGIGSVGHHDGLANLKSGGQSHLLIYVNRSDFKNAADEFSKWSKAGGVVLLGLKRRREAERLLFLS